MTNDLDIPGYIVAGLVVSAVVVTTVLLVYICIKITGIGRIRIQSFHTRNYNTRVSVTPESTVYDHPMWLPNSRTLSPLNDNNMYDNAAMFPHSRTLTPLRSMDSEQSTQHPNAPVHTQAQKFVSIDLLNAGEIVVTDIPH